MNILSTVLLLSMLLTACNSSQPENAENTEKQPSLSESIHQPLDKAKGVEQLLQDTAEQQRKQAEAL